jgi:hypothetical protein
MELTEKEKKQLQSQCFIKEEKNIKKHTKKCIFWGGLNCSRIFAFRVGSWGLTLRKVRGG